MIEMNLPRALLGSVLNTAAGSPMKVIVLLSKIIIFNEFEYKSFGDTCGSYNTILDVGGIFVLV